MSSLKNLSLIIFGGILIGVGCAVFFHLVFSPGLIPPKVRFFDVWIPVVVLVFMIILIRAGKPERTFHFWEGLMAGNLMIWLGGLLSGLLIVVLESFDPLPFQHFLQSSVKYLQIADKEAPEGLKMPNLDKVLQEFRETKPSFMIWDEVKKKVLYSFILVPLVSLIFRRK
jgi:hypothetical protein